MSDADAAPAPVTLFHELVPQGREFDPVVAVTMRLQGWTDEAGDPVDDEDDDDASDDDDPSDDDDTLPTTGFGHFTTNTEA